MMKRQKKGNFFDYNFFPKNHKGLSVILVLIIILVAAGGIYLLLQKPSPANTSGANQTPPPANIPNQSTSSIGKTYNVELRNLAFNPSTLNIKAGDAVIWTNKDATPHTITSDSGSEISSSQLSMNGVYAHTFNTAGTYDYHCSVHPSIMKGTIVVS